MTAPLISFVIPCYNYGRYLRDCIDLILAQKGGYAIEVIAINDCSTDNTLEILRSYDDPRLRIINHEVNRGHIFTVNEGMQQTRGKYVVRIDPDDRHHLNFLQTLVPVLEASDHIGLAYANINIINDKGDTTFAGADTQHGGVDFTGNELIALLKRNFICAPTVIARREAWMSAWPVPEGLAFNDWYFNLMLARRWQFHYANDVLADYRVHGSNHHAKISKDGSEEKSVLWLLDRIYNEVEEDATLEQAKLSARAGVYAAQYLDFATKYFGFEMNRDARRCFLQAIRHDPQLLFKPGVLRQLAATWLRRGVYERAKGLWKQISRAVPHP